jgi:hypothetical protein
VLLITLPAEEPYSLVRPDMPPIKFHLEQVQHNRELINTFDLDTTPYLDWVVTIAFYTSLHLVEAWFAALRRPQHFETHRDRQNEMSRVPEFNPKIYNLYRSLEDNSRATRYRCFHPRKDFVASKILANLDTLEVEIRRLLDS